MSRTKKQRPETSPKVLPLSIEESAARLLELARFDVRLDDSGYEGWVLLQGVQLRDAARNFSAAAYAAMIGETCTKLMHEYELPQNMAELVWQSWVEFKTGRTEKVYEIVFAELRKNFATMERVAKERPAEIQEITEIIAEVQKRFAEKRQRGKAADARPVAPAKNRRRKAK